NSQDIEKSEELFREKERILKLALEDKDNMIGEFKSRIQSLERSFKENQSEMEEQKISQKKLIERLISEREREFTETFEAEKNNLIRAHQEEIVRAKFEAAKDAAEKVRAEMPPVTSNPEFVRQEVEREMNNKLREQEELLDTRVKEAKEESKKDLDKLKWETE